MFGNAKVTDIVKGKTDIDLSSFSYKAASETFASEKAGYIFVKLTAASTGSDSWHMTELLSTLTEPLEIPFSINQSYDYFITIPEDMSLLTSTSNVNIHNEFGSIEISVSAEGNILHTLRKINITKTNVPVEKYDSFKTMINTWNSKKYREVLLKNGE